jgi:hypothetical protein
MDILEPVSRMFVESYGLGELAGLCGVLPISMRCTANHVERLTTTLYFPARTTDGYSRLPRDCARRHVASGTVNQCDRMWRWLGDGGKMRWRMLAPNSGEGSWRRWTG